MCVYVYEAIVCICVCIYVRTCVYESGKTNAAGESLTAEKVSKLLRSTSEDILVSYIMCVCMYMRL